MRSAPAPQEAAAPPLALVERKRTWIGSWVTALLVLTVVFLAANARLVAGRAVPIWDADAQFFPYFSLVADHAASGRLVSWDPWTNGGLPMAGDPQVGAHSPVVLALAALTGGTSHGFVAYWLLVWWLGGAGMLVLARHLRSPPWAGAVVALGFVFCGAYMTNAEHTTILVAFSSMPWVVWRLDAALVSRRLRPAFEAGAIWGLAGLSGHPAIVLIVAGVCAWWALGRALFGGDEALAGGEAVEHPRPRRVLLAAGALATMAVTGIAVLSPTYASFLRDGVGVHGRSGAMSRDAALANQLDPAALVTVASAYGPRAKARDRSIFPTSDISMVSIHLGALIPLLAVVALAARPRSAWRWWLAGLAAFMLATAIGESLPLRGWLYDWVIVTRYFRHSAVFRLGFLFAVAVLAIVGARDVARTLSARGPEPRSRIAWAVAIAAGCAVAAHAMFLSAIWNDDINRVVAAGSVAAWPAGALLLVVAWRRSNVRALALVPAALLVVAAGDALVASVLSSLTVMEGGPRLRRWRALDAAHVRSVDLTASGWRRDRTACPSFPAGARCIRNDQYFHKVPVFDAYVSAWHGAQLAMIAHPVLRDAATGTTRTWFAPEVAQLAPDTRHWEAVARRATELGAPPVVVHAPEAMRRGVGDSARAVAREPRTRTDDSVSSTLSALPAAERVEPELRTYLPDRLAFRVQVPTDGWLVLTERWAPGWSATVDGREAPIHGANFVFRALPLRAGVHEVDMRFRPAGAPLVPVSWLVLATAGLGATVARWRKRNGTGDWGLGTGD